MANETVKTVKVKIGNSPVALNGKILPKDSTQEVTPEHAEMLAKGKHLAAPEKK